MADISRPANSLAAGGPWRCPGCGHLSDRPVVVCPGCGANLTADISWRDRVRHAADAELRILEYGGPARALAHAERLRRRRLMDLLTGAVVFGLPHLGCLAIYGPLLKPAYMAISTGLGAAAGLALNIARGGAIKGFAIYGLATAADLFVAHAYMGNPLDDPGVAATLPLYLLFRIAAGLGIGRYLGLAKELDQAEGLP